MSGSVASDPRMIAAQNQAMCRVDFDRLLVAVKPESRLRFLDTALRAAVEVCGRRKTSVIGTNGQAGVDEGQIRGQAGMQETGRTRRDYGRKNASRNDVDFDGTRVASKGTVKPCRKEREKEKKKGKG